MPNALGCGVAILLLGIVLSAGAANSAEPKWPPGPYNYMIIDQDIRDVLTEFGRNLKVPVKVSDQVVGRRIHGKMPVGSAEQFLKGICDSYGVVWFYDGAVLHFSAENEVKTEQLDLGPITADAIAKKMKALGVTDARYPVSTVDTHVVSIFGPPPYVSFVRQTAATMQKALLPREGARVKVIRAGQDGS